MKQPSLKPQDLLVALKILRAKEPPPYASLARDLAISVSEAHGAARRAATSRLLVEEDGGFTANRAALREFLIHGVAYAFPFVTLGVERGVPTGASAPPLDAHFAPDAGMPLVWPSADGAVRGIAVVPLYPTVPKIALADRDLHQLLALIDAMRGGAARERELAREHIERMVR